MTTPIFWPEQVRRLIVAQMQTLNGFTHARHLFGGVATQGAVIGDRTFDVRTGRSVPEGSDASGAELVISTYRIRLRHRILPLQDANAETRQGDDRRRVEQRIRTGGGQIPDGIEMRWVETGEPVENVKGFWDTDVLVEARHWSPVTEPSPESGAAGGNT